MTQGSLKTAVSVSRAVYPEHLFPPYRLPSFRQWQVPLAFPRAWLSRRPRKDVETDQGSVHFFAFLPSPPTPGRHCPLPVMHQVHRWVKLTEEKHKQSLIRSIWQWREDAAPRGVAAKNASGRLSWLPLISGELLCIQLFHTCDSKYKRVQTVPPRGPKPSDRLWE